MYISHSEIKPKVSAQRIQYSYPLMYYDVVLETANKYA
jgi:hypothetical protein